MTNTFTACPICFAMSKHSDLKGWETDCEHMFDGKLKYRYQSRDPEESAFEDRASEEKLKALVKKHDKRG